MLTMLCPKVKKYLLYSLNFWLMFFSCFLDPGTTHGADATITATGCFHYTDKRGNEVPIRNTKVVMYDYDCWDTGCATPGPMAPCSAYMGEDFTDENGCFSITGSGSDDLWDLPDPYVQIVAESDRVNVQSAPLINYCLRSGNHNGDSLVRGRFENVGNGRNIDFGTITPSNGTGCYTDCWGVAGQDTAWNLFCLADEAQRVMNEHTLVVNGTTVAKVAVQYPMLATFYSIPGSTIMFAESQAIEERRERVLFHEYGHHVMYQFFMPTLELVYPTGDYCNGNCDWLFDQTKTQFCGHCGFRPENGSISWAEAWPHLISEMLAEHWGKKPVVGTEPDNHFNFDPNDIDYGFETHREVGCTQWSDPDACPHAGDDLNQIEGYVAAVLWDLYDGNAPPSTVNENHVPPDQSQDNIRLSFRDMWATLFEDMSPFYQCENVFDCIFHNKPLNLNEYWSALSLRAAELEFTYWQVSEVFHENHLHAPAPNLAVTEVMPPPVTVVRGGAFGVSDTTMNYSATIPGMPTVLNSTTGYYLFSGSPMPFSAIQAGTAIAIGRRSVPDLCGSGCESSGSVTATIPAGVTPGMYYLHACANMDTVIFEPNLNDNCAAASSSITILAEDADGDGYLADVDCNDNNPGMYPGAAETCNNADDNCDGFVDEGLLSVFYQDADGDGYGNPFSTTNPMCQAPAGYVSDFGDCDDADPNRSPGFAEMCNSIDDDCDGAVDENFQMDSDGIADCFDNCVLRPNPDQADADGDGSGDICDVCPASVGTTCDVNRSGGISIGAAGGTLATGDGSVSIIVPPGSLIRETSLSITGAAGSFALTTDQGDATAYFGVTILPEGQAFSTPVTIIFSWPDSEPPLGKIDGTNIREAGLLITKDGVALTGTCGTDPRCDTGVNTFSIQVTSFSQFTLAVLNGPPVVGTIAAPIDPLPVNSGITASVSFTDPGFLDSHTAMWSWGDGAVTAGVVTEEGGTGTVTGYHTYATPGIYTIMITVTDSRGLTETSGSRSVIVYDPNGGFVTGGGRIFSPAGALAPNPGLSGKATFGFSAKYGKGATVPSGSVEFKLKAGNLHFHSRQYQWLVVFGGRAQLKGVGTINGTGAYGFMLTVAEGRLPRGRGGDRFRLKIWDLSSGEIIYDNQAGASDTANPSTTIAGGSITIHKAK